MAPGVKYSSLQKKKKNQKSEKFRVYLNSVPL